MDPIDSNKGKFGNLLPRDHLFLILALSGFLLVISAENDFEGPPLVKRTDQGNIAEIVEKPATAPVIASNAPPGTPMKAGFAMSDPKPAITPASPETRPPRGNDTPTPSYVTEVKSGDNLSLIFARAGLSARDVYEVSRSKPESAVLTNLYPGYRLAFNISDSGELETLEIIKSKLESYRFRRDGAGYQSEHILKTPEVRQVFREATINDSLFLSARRGGISAAITMELAGIFGGVIDFLLDTRQGDGFNLLYEEKYLDGEFIGNGDILAAQFTNQGETFTAVRYVNNQGETDFYNPEGESMRKAFLRNPVDFTRISDGFNPNRKHPILNVIRAHKGTDYAAPRGTPVVATGDGRVTWVGRNGSFGKLVVIQHGQRFQTKYAHLNDYARGVKKGARIRQGQIIGYVGSTGGATGPHLHYEFLLDGVHRNSRTIHNRLPKAESVPEQEMQRFREHTQILLSQLDTHLDSNRTLAQASTDNYH